MFKLKYNRVELEVSEIGSELRSLKIDSKDVLWNGDPKYWSSTAPIMFPVCGGLPEDKFTIDGKEFPLSKHGFIKMQKFEKVNEGNNFITLMSKSNEETLKSYPWEYEFYTTFEIRGAALEITYAVKNLSDSTMYFSVGSHEAYACPEGIEDYDLIFEKNENLDSWVLNGNFLEHKTERFLKDSNTLPLYYKYYAVDALVFKDIKSRFVTLRNRKTGRKVSVSFPDSKYLVTWTKPDAGYICIEPWCGIQGMIDDGFDITKKEGIMPLNPSKTFSYKHTIYMD